ERGRRALADDEPLLAVVLFPPGEVVVVVDAQLVARAEDAQHAVDDPVTAGIGILAGDVHRCEIAVGERRAELNRGGRRVHAVIDALAPLLPALQREKSGRGLVAEAARAEVDADPEPAVRAILEQVHVMVAAADGAELRLRQREQRSLLRDRAVRDGIEDRRVANRLVVLAAHAERDRAPDLVHHAAHVEVRGGEIRSHRAVAARDVVADARGHDDRLRGEDAADRHRIALVVVGAEHAARLVAARVEAAIDLRARIGLDGSERDELVGGGHNKGGLHDRVRNRVRLRAAPALGRTRPTYLRAATGARRNPAYVRGAGSATRPGAIVSRTRRILDPGRTQPQFTAKQ